MRVVAGIAKGRKLLGPSSTSTRPTTDRVREAIFNSLETYDLVDGATVADLFAGTGACGIEALSRGAASVTFVEKDRKAIEVIKTNLSSVLTDEIGSGEVVQSDVLAYLSKKTSGGGAHFDIVFADPPYEFDQWNELLGLIDAHLVICESGESLEFPQDWECTRERRYGDTMVSIIRRKP